MTDNDMMLFSDAYKSVHGVRPRWMQIETAEQLDEAWRVLDLDIAHQRALDEAESQYLSEIVEGITIDGKPLTRDIVGDCECLGLDDLCPECGGTGVALQPQEV